MSDPRYQMGDPRYQMSDPSLMNEYNIEPGMSKATKLGIAIGIFVLVISIMILLYFFTDIFATSKTITGCEATPLNLKCESEQKIKSGKVKFGRWDNSVCLGPGVTPSTVARFKEYDLPEKCKGKESCNININLANEGNINDFGQGPSNDPYPNVTKHYEVNYKCQ